MAHTSTKKNECGLPPGAGMYYSPPPPPLISLVVGTKRFIGRVIKDYP